LFGCGGKSFGAMINKIASNSCLTIYEVIWGWPSDIYRITLLSFMFHAGTLWSTMRKMKKTKYAAHSGNHSLHHGGIPCLCMRLGMIPLIMEWFHVMHVVVGNNSFYNGMIPCLIHELWNNCMLCMWWMGMIPSTMEWFHISFMSFGTIPLAQIQFHEFFLLPICFVRICKYLIYFHTKYIVILF